MRVADKSYRRQVANGATSQATRHRWLTITDGAMTQQRRPGRYPDEMRERAVRMVFEAQRHCGSQWEAIRLGG